MAEQATAPEKTHEIPAHGSICWTELMTSDPEVAKIFYSELFGWQMHESELDLMPGVKYTEIETGGKRIGGIFKMGEECSQGGAIPSHWMSYVAVDDADAIAAKCTELGGTVCVPPTDIPGVGRFTVVTDPTGAVISALAFPTA